jgi:hypothetical protein
MPAGPAPDVVIVDYAQRAVTLRSFARREAIAVRLARAALFGGVVAPLPSQSILWTSATRGRVSAEYEVRTLIRAPLRLSAEVPCEALTLDRGEFDPVKQHIGSSNDAWQLRASASIPLLLTPGAKPTLALTVANGQEPTAYVVAREGIHRRVVVPTREEVFIGWVRSDALKPLVGAGFSGVSEGGGGLDYARAPGQARLLRCSDRVPLVAEQGQVRVRIGWLERGATLAAGAEHAGWTSIAFEDPVPMSLAPGAKLIARTGDIARCADVSGGTR